MADNVPNLVDFEQRWASLRAKIVEKTDILEQRGSIRTRIARGKTVFVLRFEEFLDGGRRVDRAIYLGGDEEIVRRARDLLARIRQRADWQREAELFVNLAATLSYRAKRTVRRLSLPRSQRA